MLAKRLFTTSSELSFARESEDIGLALLSCVRRLSERALLFVTTAGPLTLDWPARVSSTLKTPSWKSCTKQKTKNRDERTEETARHLVSLGWTRRNNNRGPSNTKVSGEKTREKLDTTIQQYGCFRFSPNLEHLKTMGYYCRLYVIKSH